MGYGVQAKHAGSLLSRFALFFNNGLGQNQEAVLNLANGVGRPDRGAGSKRHMEMPGDPHTGPKVNR